ncbi:MAG: chlorophyllide reductase subunit Y, partial [Devosiaceae bacterium]|nr:chlorophyllide reductase subunit Y [Devosiaceae bacterium MH13]
IHPFYTASFREFEAAGRPIVGSGPVGREGTAAWLEAIGKACGVSQTKVDAAKAIILPAIDGALAAMPIRGRITVSGYEGSELLVARLLIESGADVRYVGTALPRTPYSDPDREWLEAKGVAVQFRASLEQDLAAVKTFEPDLAIGTTPVVQKAKELSIPALYFTNLISARPLMGAAGAGSLAQVVNAALANKARFETMTAFFEGVGAGDTAGVWEDTPADNSAFKKKYAARLASQSKRVVEGSTGC